MIAAAGAGASSAGTSTSSAASSSALRPRPRPRPRLVCPVLRMTRPSLSLEALIIGEPLREPPLREPGARPARPPLPPQLVDARHRLLRRHPLRRRQERQRHRPQAELEQAAAVRALQGVLALPAGAPEQLQL